MLKRTETCRPAGADCGGIAAVLRAAILARARHIQSDQAGAANQASITATACMLTVNNTWLAAKGNPVDSVQPARGCQAQCVQLQVALWSLCLSLQPADYPVAVPLVLALVCPLPCSPVPTRFPAHLLGRRNSIHRLQGKRRSRYRRVVSTTDQIPLLLRERYLHQDLDCLVGPPREGLLCRSAPTLRIRALTAP